MRAFLSSIYYRVSAVLMFVLLLLGASLAYVFAYSGQQGAFEAVQLLNWEVASALAEKISPYTKGSIDYAAVNSIVREYRELSPGADVYLLSADGTLAVSFGEKAYVKRSRVELAPVQEYLKGDPNSALPIYGEDPRYEDGQSIISAAPLTLGTEPGYVYVVFGGGNRPAIANIVKTRFITGSTLVVCLVAIGIALAIGMVLFFLITKRLRRVMSAVRRFKDGDLTGRIATVSGDEVGMLASTYNEMADTIASQIEALEEKDRLRRELISGMSHDLRGPLTSIHGFVEEMLIPEFDLDEEERTRNLEIVFRNIKNLTNLVSELFEYSKLDAQDIKPEEAPFSVNELVENVSLKFEPIAAKSGVQVEISAPNPPVFALGDIGMLELVLSNLVDNAIRYTEEGGGVRVGVTELEDEVCFEISDSGVGIPEEDLPYIFDRFYRVDTGRSKEIGGTGLGLAIVKKIVEAHGAEIRVELARARDGRRRFRGHLTAADQSSIEIDVDGTTWQLPLADVHMARLVPTD